MATLIGIECTASSDYRPNQFNEIYLSEAFVLLKYVINANFIGIWKLVDPMKTVKARLSKGTGFYCVVSKSLIRFYRAGRFNKETFTNKTRKIRVRGFLKKMTKTDCEGALFSRRRHSFSKFHKNFFWGRTSTQRRCDFLSLIVSSWHNRLS